MQRLQRAPWQGTAAYSSARSLASALDPSLVPSQWPKCLGHSWSHQTCFANEMVISDLNLQTAARGYNSASSSAGSARSTRSDQISAHFRVRCFSLAYPFGHKRRNQLPAYLPAFLGSGVVGSPAARRLRLGRVSRSIGASVRRLIMSGSRFGMMTASITYR